MKRVYVLCWILTGLMLVVACVFFPWLPDEIAVQWNNGAVSNTAGRWIVFALPALTAAIIGLHTLQIGKTETERKFQHWFLMVPILLFGVQAVILSNAMGYIDLCSVDFWFAQTVALLLAGGLLLLFGNSLPKLAKNYYCGVKTPWAYASDDLWTKTQRFSAKLWCAAGILIMLLSFIRWNGISAVVVGIVLLIFVLPRVYSQRLYAKTRKP